MEALPLAFTTGWASGINAYTSPEPLTNLAASSAEDMAVAGGLARFRAWWERRRAPAAGTSVA
jgi:hypothetical protein